MKKLIFLACIASLILSDCTTDKNNLTSEPNNLSGQEMQWWTDAKFGMFIHWGPYAVLGGEWNDQQLPIGVIAEWIMLELEIPVEEYKKIALPHLTLYSSMRRSG